MVTRLLTIVGDTNVRRNMTGLNIASREAMKSAQIIDYNGAGPISTVLADVRPDSSVCIVAAITDYLLSNGDCGTIFASIDPLLTDFLAQIVQFCSSRPNLQVCVVYILQTPDDWFILICYNCNYSCNYNRTKLLLFCVVHADAF